MAVAAMTDSLHRAVGPPGVLVQAVLDSVPAERHSDQFLGGGVDLARSERPISSHEHADYGILNSARAGPQLALRLRSRP
jgi:hypothetical protein